MSWYDDAEKVYKMISRDAEAGNGPILCDWRIFKHGDKYYCTAAEAKTAYTDDGYETLAEAVIDACNKIENWSTNMSSWDVLKAKARGILRKYKHSGNLLYIRDLKKYAEMRKVQEHYLKTVQKP